MLLRQHPILTGAGSSPTAKALAACLLGATLAGCEPAPEQPTRPQIVARAASLQPADPLLAERYARSCALCHARDGSGAPLTGDAAAWAARRAAAGDATAQPLVAVRQGLGAMPPMGLCPDCSDEQLAALTRFMADPGPRP